MGLHLLVDGQTQEKESNCTASGHQERPPAVPCGASSSMENHHRSGSRVGFVALLSSVVQPQVESLMGDTCDLQEKTTLAGLQRTRLVERPDDMDGLRRKRLSTVVHAMEGRFGSWTFETARLSSPTGSCKGTNSNFSILDVVFVHEDQQIDSHHLPCDFREVPLWSSMPLLAGKQRQKGNGPCGVTDDV